jgi:hypothetical protein
MLHGKGRTSRLVSSTKGRAIEPGRGASHDPMRDTTSSFSTGVPASFLDLAVAKPCASSRSTSSLVSPTSSVPKVLGLGQLCALTEQAHWTCSILHLLVRSATTTLGAT